jgi:hypothetical protein
MIRTLQEAPPLAPRSHISLLHMVAAAMTAPVLVLALVPHTVRHELCQPSLMYQTRKDSLDYNVFAWMRRITATKVQFRRNSPLKTAYKLCIVSTQALGIRLKKCSALPMQLPCFGFLASLIKTRRHAFGIYLSRAPFVDVPTVEAIKRHYPLLC